MQLRNLQKHYKFVCNEWIAKFQNKQKIDFEYWVGDQIGGIAVFNSEYFFDLQDIILDLTTKQKKGLIIDWHNDQVEYKLLHGTVDINYKSYTMGLRHKHIIESL